MHLQVANMISNLLTFDVTNTNKKDNIKNDPLVLGSDSSISNENGGSKENLALEKVETVEENGKILLEHVIVLFF